MATVYDAGTVTLEVKSNWHNHLDLSDPPEYLRKSLIQQYTEGTGNEQVQIQWHKSATLPMGETETLNLQALTGGTFGGTTLFSKVKELIIINKTTTDAYLLQVGGAASQAFSDWVVDATDKVKVRPAGGIRLWSPLAGFTVDSTHKNLKLTNDAAGDIDYDIIIIGIGTVT